MGTDAPGISGARAEDAALKHLQRLGLKLIARNYRCKVGELDLIMEDEQHLVFIEVRLRNNPHFGDGGDSITSAKQQKLARAAGVFLMRHAQFQDRPCRFDVVSVSKRNYRTICRWIPDAFR